MNAKRKNVEAHIYKHLTMLDPSGTNTARYTKFFASMNDTEFHEYMVDLREGREQLHIYVPNMRVNLVMENILAAADSLGLSMFERLWIEDAATGATYLTPEAYLILQVPVRRVKQYLHHKLSVAEGDSRIDLLSGQVTKPDSAASISLVEMQTLAARGLHHTVAELAKYRGGDIHAYAHLKQELEETGSTRVSLDGTGTVARSAAVLEVLMHSMHINLDITRPSSNTRGA